jgi:hypothetical protein
MKKALRKGDYKALNVYFQYSIGGNFGVYLALLTLIYSLSLTKTQYCYFPEDVTTGSNDFYVRPHLLLHFPIRLMFHSTTAAQSSTPQSQAAQQQTSTSEKP